LAASLAPVHVPRERIQRLAARLKEGPLPPPQDFTHSRDTPFYPPRGAAWSVPFFFSTVKHLFGLWTEDGGAFTGEVRGRIDGRLFSGDDFLWMAASRTAQETPDVLLPAGQAALDEAKLARAFRADDNTCPVPLLRSHAELAREYGKALLDSKQTPHKILEAARAAADPLTRFVELVSELPGYREDRLQRKTFLLALILSRRPEHFLPVADAAWPPLPGRHALRVALRFGAVEISDPEVAATLEKRRAVPPVVEERVRLAAYDAFAQLSQGSGRSVPELFPLFSSARDWCPEDRAPDCDACVFSAPCARRTMLHAPVVRTTAY
jgi:hypothetical protein